MEAVEAMVMPEGEASVELGRERLPADEPVSSRGKHASPRAHPSGWNASEAHSSSRRAAEVHPSDAASMHAAAEAASATVETAPTVETATTATVASTTATVASTTAAASENSGRSSKANCSQRH
jgi:hypothetical protein